MFKGRYSSLISIALLMFFTRSVLNETSVKTVEITLPEKKAVDLQPYATIDFPAINEASGLVKSR